MGVKSAVAIRSCFGSQPSKRVAEAGDSDTRVWSTRRAKRLTAGRQAGGFCSWGPASMYPTPGTVTIKSG